MHTRLYLYKTVKNGLLITSGSFVDVRNYLEPVYIFSTPCSSSIYYKTSFPQQLLRCTAPRTPRLQGEFDIFFAFHICIGGLFLNNIGGGMVCSPVVKALSTPPPPIVARVRGFSLCFFVHCFLFSFSLFFMFSLSLSACHWGGVVHETVSMCPY